ncbi:hypothetical protein [Arthrobacter sp. AL12]|uniref:hypothetical protein n=1 Tax=Arthrobacter sp. AL12 TaxID=3042241 RepID=UPI00249C545F|nr:hypothetical protein [Arthrobacter sp. AL12]MDI3211760.1 hypothetical protein [Arthrobacter sp. AL12]
MASNTISILIKAQDNASKVIKDVGDNIDGAGRKSQASAKSIGGLNDHMGALAGVTATAGVATYSLIGMMDRSISSANKYQAALTGLNSVATAFGHDAGLAERAAQSLAKDGLMTVTDAAIGLKNLLASGFSLDEAVTLMKRFKDSAAFGRQSALSFGQAVSSATEGIKNGNSILVDNAGVTKNLSNMLTEAGYSAQDLSKATTDAGVRQALFSGILKETNAQSGDAAKLADSAAGKQAVWAAQTEVLNQKIGMALQPALLSLLQTMTPIITAVADWVSKNPELSAGLVIGTTAVVGLTTAVGTLALAAAGLGPVFTLFKVVSLASIGAVGTGFAGLAALVASPIVMPAIAVAAAIGALMAVYNAAKNARAAVEEATAAKARLSASDEKDKQVFLSVLNSPASAERKATAQRGLNNIYARGNASGTAYSPGGSTLVGENGPEIVNMPRGASVTQAYRTRNELASEGSGGVTNILSGNFTFQSAEAVQAFFNRLDKTQRLAKFGMAS